jgi:hypothetical protein
LKSQRPVNKQRVLKFVEIPNTNATMRWLAEDDLQKVTAAAAQRATRQKENRGWVQKGGVITSKNARLAIDALVEAGAQKAARAAARKYKDDHTKATSGAAATQSKELRFVSWQP